MKSILLSICMLICTSGYSQRIAVATYDKDSLFIVDSMYEIMVKAWDDVREEPRPALIELDEVEEFQKKVCELEEIEETIFRMEEERKRAEKWERLRQSYWLLFGIPIPN